MGRQPEDQGHCCSLKDSSQLPQMRTFWGAPHGSEAGSLRTASLIQELTPCWVGWSWKLSRHLGREPSDHWTQKKWELATAWHEWFVSPCSPLLGCLGHWEGGIPPDHLPPTDTQGDCSPCLSVAITTAVPVSPGRLA